MTTMLFYGKIAPLNRDRHRKLRLRMADDKARYASSTHYVPIAGTEFYQAARDFPVLFSGGGGEGGPIALLGLREEENLFVEEDGSTRVRRRCPRRCSFRSVAAVRYAGIPKALWPVPGATM